MPGFIVITFHPGDGTYIKHDIYSEEASQPSLNANQKLGLLSDIPSMPYVKIDAADPRGWSELGPAAKEIRRRVIAFLEIRKKRQEILRATDHLLLSDANVTAQELVDWLAYRQAIRDLPQTYPNPDDIVWPSPPGIPPL